ncbi:MAG TPA: electron transfer flavoprotein subunit beta/FixA family protein [Syntrophorhabdales bacterium]|nr:electron transfer flavoprotein subunit beta/FixA family protein [Syntrophorhabdales bacterium]
MNIVVLAKQVPDPEAFVEIRGDGTGLEIEPKFATNLFDEFALEEALRLREKHGGKVKVITLGGGKATEVLRTGIAMGADEALLLDDPAFFDGDGYATALALSRAIKREPFDLVLCGKQATDDDRGEVGPMVAQFLNLPHVGGITKLDIADGKATTEFPVEGGKTVAEVPLPAVFTAQKGLNEARVPLITGVMKAMKVQIPKVTPQELGLSAEEIGKAGSKVRIVKYLPPKKRAGVHFIPGDAGEAAAEVVRILVDEVRVI